tara:strand:- start:210 stop:2261 length:2052 start_codon:yes stop_codon:yes gene_type:complete
MSNGSINNNNSLVLKKKYKTGNYTEKNNNKKLINCDNEQKNLKKYKEINVFIKKNKLVFTNKCFNNKLHPNIVSIYINNKFKDNLEKYYKDIIENKLEDKLKIYLKINAEKNKIDIQIIDNLFQNKKTNFIIKNKNKLNNNTVVYNNLHSNCIQMDKKINSNNNCLNYTKDNNSEVNNSNVNNYNIDDLAKNLAEIDSNKEKKETTKTKSKRINYLTFENFKKKGSCLDKTSNARIKNTFLQYNLFYGLKENSFSNTEIQKTKIVSLFNLLTKLIIIDKRKKKGETIEEFNSRNTLIKQNLSKIIFLQKCIKKNRYKINSYYRGPGINNLDKCVNITDYMFMDEIKYLDKNDVFTYQETENNTIKCKQIYAFKMESFNELATRNLDNPYTRNKINENVIEHFLKLHKIYQKWSLLNSSYEKHLNSIIKKYLNPTSKSYNINYNNSYILNHPLYQEFKYELLKKENKSKLKDTKCLDNNKIINDNQLNNNNQLNNSNQLNDTNNLDTTNDVNKMDCENTAYLKRKREIQEEEKLEFEERKKINKKQTFDKKSKSCVVSLFKRIDMYGFRTEIEWVHGASCYRLIKLIKEFIHDIFKFSDEHQIILFNNTNYLDVIHYISLFRNRSINKFKMLLEFAKFLETVLNNSETINMGETICLNILKAIYVIEPHRVAEQNTIFRNLIQY